MKNVMICIAVLSLLVGGLGCSGSASENAGGGEISSIFDTVCSKVSECEDVSLADCISSLNNDEDEAFSHELADNFGIGAVVGDADIIYTHSEAQTAIDDGTYIVNDDHLNSCLDEIEALTCDDVTSAFDVAGGWQNVENIIPQDHCPNSFTLSE